ncbi:MAG: cobalt-precorrin-5B (C(1))-methyltransferase CbiD [Prochlorococcaceae cyanobacterium]
MTDGDLGGSSGHTLPVWVTAAAVAALRQLRGEPFQSEETLELLRPSGRRPLPVEQAAPLGNGEALAISRCDPGPGLDLTRGLAVWVRASWGPLHSAGGGPIRLQAGAGVGRRAQDGEICISAYARELLEANLLPLLPADRGIDLEVTLPDGQALAQRTSLAAFGVVDGLALIGTGARVQASASPDRLGLALDELQRRAAAPGGCRELVLVVGENGLDLAPTFGLATGHLLKAGNWIGPLLAAAAEAGVERLLLWGYHGKLLKLAGGIFHTHHHLADCRAEVLTALAALEGLQNGALERLFSAPTVDEALRDLSVADPALEGRLRQRIVAAIEARSAAYIQRCTGRRLDPGVALFDRSRRLWAVGPQGVTWFPGVDP